MSPQIQFKAGQVVRYIATRTFSLGASGLNITKDMELDFDGTHVTTNGHPPLAIPQLRGAVKQGWIVPESEYDPDDMTSSIPRSAGISMRNADGGNPMDPQKPRIAVTTVDAEEREVGDVAAHARQTKIRNATPRGQRLANTSNILVEEQDGVPVRSLSTPTHQTTNLENGFGEAVRQANKVQIRPGTGRTREDVLASMSESEQEQYLAELAAKKDSYVEGEDPQVIAERTRNTAILNRRVVGQAPVTKNQMKEGFNINNTVGGGIETVDLGGTGGAGANQVDVVEIDGIRITNTNGPKRGAKVAAATTPAQTRVVATVGGAPVDSRRRIAKSICPDFPDNYVFEDSPRKKIARLQADYEDRPDVIRAVAAAEMDADIRNRLVEEFPDAFN